MSMWHRKTQGAATDATGTVYLRQRRSEARDIWFAIAILLVLSAYRMVSGLISYVEGFFLAYTEVPVAEYLVDGLFFWLLALLWISYRRWQAAVAAKQELERVIGSISPDVLIVVDQERAITMCSGSARTMFGRERAELLGIKTEELYFDRRLTGRKGELYRLLEEVGFHIGTATGRHRDGHTFPLELITGKIREQEGVVILLRDITDRRQVEDALRESEERFEQFMRYLPASAYIKDSQGRFVYMNDYVEQAFGWNVRASIGKTDFDLFPESYAQAYQGDDRLTLQRNAVQRTVEQVPQRDQIRTMLTYRFPIIRSDAPPLLGAISLDITDRQRADEERRKLEQQMQQTQKLESLGLLGGGIAHDFNNLLMGILGNADLALQQLSANAPVRECLEKVITATRRASELANQLLAYSGEGKLTVKPLNLSDLIRDLYDLLVVSVSKKTTLDLQLKDGLPAIECDINQIRQVIMNLVINASEACGDQSGRILIETGLRHWDSQNQHSPYLPEIIPTGNYVFLSIGDTGCGMDETTRSRMFDPFFSTKFAGRGLGLAATLGIIRSHRGTVQVASAEGVGTTVTVLLPISTKTAQPIHPPDLAVGTWTGMGTILVVDDEDAVRDVACRMLEKLGFEVLEAADGQAALELFARQGDNIDAVLIDMTMPMLGGRESAAEMRIIRPGVPIVFSSGYNKPDEFGAETGPHATRFLQKPYRLDAMRACFEQVLGAQKT